ncbi:nitroreductase family protein [Clostridium grantii]|uniref:Nitroreductase n=1 Tax=Clostridium grantii DSM 8605 TaxID=1121316 RepID=A0A1M5SLH0_9CLOT|nr:nitroreductase family protein [Clostridium grantii]SHH39402.1 Nitroreductase [Clostridium grantii DSM 8605]
MDFYNVIDQRRSAKKFNSIKVDCNSLDRMIDAALMSPSWKNKSSYKMIIVEDNEKRNQISFAIENRTDEAANALREAPMVVVMVGEPSVSGNLDGKEMYLVDGAIAMEHFILAATEEGYGTCWVASFDEKKVKDILSIPEGFKIIGMTPLGKAAELKEHYEKKDRKEYVYYDKWDISHSNKKSKENKVH